ncbi:MAG: hypothetical protein HUJ98_05985, partial [Bacteroidaceae bacterium]|nr:hypothetical protein [Bacteroidaceae bacterium]
MINVPKNSCSFYHIRRVHIIKISSKINSSIKNMSIRLNFRKSTKLEKEGTLFYQVIHKRETRRIKSKYRIHACEWDAVTESIAIPPPNSPRYNILLQIANDCKWDIQRLTDIEKTLG